MCVYICRYVCIDIDICVYVNVYVYRDIDTYVFSPAPRPPP